MDMRTGVTTKGQLSWENEETPIRIDCDKCRFAIWAAVRDGVPTEIVCPRSSASGKRCGGVTVVTRRAPMV